MSSAPPHLSKLFGKQTVHQSCIVAWLTDVARHMFKPPGKVYRMLSRQNHLGISVNDSYYEKYLALDSNKATPIHSHPIQIRLKPPHTIQKEVGVSK